MSRFRVLLKLICLGFGFLLAGCATPSEPVHLIKPNVLPLALSDDFEFRKTKLFFSGSGQAASPDAMINFQQKRVAYGAVDKQDTLERQGNYFTFFWKAHRRADLSVRLEYRTQTMGDYVQAREIAYHRAKGTYKTHFRVVGNDYVDDGRITAWRALLIENGAVVALDQSMLWN